MTLLGSGTHHTRQPWQPCGCRHSCVGGSTGPAHSDSQAGSSRVRSSAASDKHVDICVCCGKPRWCFTADTSRWFATLWSERDGCQCMLVLSSTGVAAVPCPLPWHTAGGGTYQGFCCCCCSCDCCSLNNYTAPARWPGHGPAAQR